MIFFFFLTQFFVSSHIHSENPEGTQVIVGSMNMEYISDTARNRTHNLFRPKREPIPLGHSDGRNSFSYPRKHIIAHARTSNSRGWNIYINSECLLGFIEIYISLTPC